jgi:hypothetical protein
MTDRLRSLPPGVLVAGIYRIERRLGEGRVGPVVLARDTRTDQPVAVKFMRPPTEARDGAAWFLREARAASRLESEFVARVSDSGTLDDLPYLVMEYLEGQTFKALLERPQHLSVPLLVTYALQVVEALAEAHALGIVHRDVKPSNLFLTRRSDGSTRVKLLDFGIAKSVYGPGDSIEQSGDASPHFGSPRWMAPEQIRASSDADRRSDLFSLGAVLYHALVGDPPFGDGTSADLCARILNDEPTPLRTMRPDVPETLDAAVMQCLEKDPQRRFRSAGALARALAAGGTSAARQTAERIARIATRSITSEHEATAEEVTPAASTLAIVPQALTQTGFGRAVEGIERIVTGDNVDGVPPGVIVVASPAVTTTMRLPVTYRPPVPFRPTETPASFATPPKPSRLRGVPVMLVFSGIAAAAVVALFLFGRSGADAPDGVVSSQAGTAPPALSAPSSVAPTPVVVPAIEVPSTPRASAPAATPSAPVPPVPASSAAPHAKRRPRPADSATPTTAPPIGTAGFGGRN